MLASNKGFEAWGQIRHEKVKAAASLGDLSHHGELSRSVHPTAANAVHAEQAQIKEQS